MLIMLTWGYLHYDLAACTQHTVAVLVTAHGLNLRLTFSELAC